MRTTTVIILLLSIGIMSKGHLQEKADMDTSSLIDKSYIDLGAGFSRATSLAIKEQYVAAFIEKARKEKDTLYILGGFQLYTLAYKGEKAIQYADSIIHYTKEKPDSQYPAVAYLVKGIEYDKQGNFKKALDNFIMGNTYASRFFNVEVAYKCNYKIGVLKDRLGEYEEAISIHKHNAVFAEKHKKKIGKQSMILSTFGLAFSYKNLKKLDSAYYYNDLGLQSAREIKNEELVQHFLLNEGIINYWDRQYTVAREKISETLKYFEKENKQSDIGEAYYYLGKIQDQIGNKEQAIVYYKKVDTIFQKTKDLIPESREAYNYLTSYYRDQGDQEQQLVYLEKLIALDKALNSNQIYLSKKIIEKFDIPKMIAEKEELITKLESDKINLNYIVGALFLLFVLILGYFYQRQRMLKKKFNQILKEDTKEVEVIVPPSDKVTLEVPQEIAEHILKCLEEFEQKKGFLDKNITLSSLSKLFKTNSSYLSKTINFYRDKNFPTYLNDLRIEYALEKLKEDPSFRKYTIKAIAGEVGFKSAETFSKFFLKKNGMYPSYFIKQLSKMESS